MTAEMLLRQWATFDDHAAETVCALWEKRGVPAYVARSLVEVACAHLVDEPPRDCSR
jgi:hypothetical protein